MTLKIQNYKVRFFTTSQLMVQKFHIDTVTVMVLASTKTSRGCWIHATGIQSWEQLIEFRDILEQGFSCKIIQTKIDSIFLSKKGYQNHKVDKLLSKCSKYKQSYFVFFSCEHLSAIQMSPRAHVKPYPSFLFFLTGSVTCMGSQNLQHVQLAQEIVNHVYSA